MPEAGAEQTELFGSVRSARVAVRSGVRRDRGERQDDQQDEDGGSTHGFDADGRAGRTVSQRSAVLEGYAPTLSPGRTRASSTDAPAPTTAPSPRTVSLTRAPVSIVACGPTTTCSFTVAPRPIVPSASTNGDGYGRCPFTRPSSRSNCACRYACGVPRSIQYASDGNPARGRPAAMSA